MKEIKLNDPQADVVESTAQRVLMHCGVGIGKSHCIGFIALDFVRNNPEVRGFIGANTYSQLSKSTLDRVFTVWEQVFGLIKDVHYVVDRIPPESFKTKGSALKSYENTIAFNNGALIFIASLDNYKVIDGTEFGWACLDETKDTKEEAVKEVIVARLRQIGMFVDDRGILYKADICERRCAEGRWKKIFDHDGFHYENDDGGKVEGYNPLYIFTSPAKAKWLMQWFKLDDDAEEITKAIFVPNSYYRKRKGNQFVVIASTYHNSENLSPGYIQRLMDDLGQNKGLIDMLIFGSPFGKSGGEFYSAYDRQKHIKPVTPNPKLPVHISLDFNVVPYITMTLWQIESHFGKYKVRCFAELCLPSPKNNIEALCREAEAKYGHLFKAGLFYYGDYSGKAGNTISNEYKDHYDALEKLLPKYLSNYSDRVIVNPRVAKRRNFINKVFAGGYPIEIEIDPSCKEFVGDLEFTKEGPDGAKLKNKVKDKSRDITYEEHGHTSDAMDYFLCSAFSSYFET